LKTGFTCKVSNCRCQGIDFRSRERLDRHELQGVKKKQQCVSPRCGCGKFFAKLGLHMALVQKKREKEAELNRGGSRDKEGERDEDAQLASENGKGDQGANTDLVSSKQPVTGNGIKREVGDQDNIGHAAKRNRIGIDLTGYSDDDNEASLPVGNALKNQEEDMISSSHKRHHVQKEEHNVKKSRVGFSKVCHCVVFCSDQN
jgi:hypothetical protein